MRDFLEEGDPSPEEAREKLKKLAKHFNEMDEELSQKFDDIALYRLYQARRQSMSLMRYKELMQEISVIYYDENRHSIITGHRNGSICIWS